MPHALTPRQKEYLEFIREYIKQNECSPRLEEVAEHFNVKSPTAHKTLKTLMRAGYLYFGLRPHPAIQLSYQGAEGDERFLCLSFAGLQAQSRLIHDITSRTGLPLGPSS